MGLDCLDFIQMLVFLYVPAWDIGQLELVTVVDSFIVMAEQQLLSPHKYIVKRSKSSFSSGERRIILHIYGILRRENPDMTKREVAERVGVLTGAGRGTVEKLRQEFAKGPLVTPGKKGQGEWGSVLE